MLKKGQIEFLGDLIRYAMVVMKGSCFIKSDGNGKNNWKVRISKTSLGARIM